jgi:hypothetical protein
MSSSRCGTPPSRPASSPGRRVFFTAETPRARRNPTRKNLGELGVSAVRKEKELGVRSFDRLTPDKERCCGELVRK